jgi:hypothetical protein
MDTEQTHEGRRKPIHQRGLIEETNAVYVRCNEVTPDEHLPSALNVDRIDIVQQSGGEDAVKLQTEPYTDQGEKRRDTPNTYDGATGGNVPRNTVSDRRSFC